MTSLGEKIRALFVGRSDGQFTRTTVYGQEKLFGARPVKLVIEQTLPDNAEALEKGLITFAETHFHRIFGMDAVHLTPEGEEAQALEESIIVEIVGEADPEAVEETYAEIERLVLEENQRRRAQRDEGPVSGDDLKRLFGDDPTLN